jgi:hypothetical protein
MLTCVDVIEVTVVTVISMVLVTLAAGWSSIFVETVLTVSRMVDVEGASVVALVLVQKGMVIVLVLTSFRIFTQFTA